MYIDIRKKINQSFWLKWVKWTWTFYSAGPGELQQAEAEMGAAPDDGRFQWFGRLKKLGAGKGSAMRQDRKNRSRERS